MSDIIDSTDTEEIICVECNDTVDSDDKYMCPDGDEYCNDCFHEYFVICECSDTVSIDDAMSAQGEYYCQDCYDETFSHCDSCEVPVTNDYIHYSESRESYYCESCFEDIEDEEASDFVSNSPSSPTVRFDKSETKTHLNVDRLVGFEVECVLDNAMKTESGESLALLERPSGFRDTYDGSITADMGRELISRPASGDILYKRVSDLGLWASTYNVEVNKSCGFHVHIDATDTDWNDLRHISLVNLDIEPLLYAMMPKSRGATRQWCKKFPISKLELLQMNRESDFVEAWYEGNSINREKYNDSRYHGLNLHARFYLGTIEFRYHSGTVNTKKMKNWILICNSIVETGIHRARNNDVFNHQPIQRLAGTSTSTLGEKFYHLDKVTRDMIGFTQEMRRYMRSRISLFHNDINTNTNGE